MINPLVKAAPQLPKRRPSQDDFAKLQLATADDLRALAKKLADGDIDTRAWYVRFSNMLLERHADAWVLGRQLSGDLSAPDIADELVGRAKADQESEWLLSFLHDLEAGPKYLDDEGKVKYGPVANRSSMYAGKLRGTANEAFIESSPQDAEFDWILGGTEAHCSDCPTLAGMSPWRKDELGTWPGEGGTPCLTRCLCKIVRLSDSRSGFRPV